MNWTCNDTRRSMLRQLELPDEAIEHLASCELCQQVSDIATVTGNSGPEPPVDVEQLLKSTRGELAEERGWLAWFRSRPLRLQRALGLTAALLPVALQLLLARRGDFAEFPLPRMLVFGIAYAVAIVLATSALLTPLYRTRLPGTSWVAALLAMAVPLLFVMTNSETADAAVTRLGLDYLRGAYSCLRYGVLLSAPSVVLLLVMDRSAARRRLTGLVAAALGGAVGNFVLLLHCSNPESTHQFLGHALVSVVLLLLIGLVGVFAKLGPMR